MASIKKILAGVFLVLASSFVFYAQKVSAGGMTLSPAFQNIDVTPAATRLDESITIQNNEDYPVVYDLAVIDMGSLEDTGGVVFSGLSADYKNKYGLASWVTLSKTEVTIAGKGAENVDFTVNNSKEFSPGGHYGAVVVIPKTEGNINPNSVELSPRAATLLFVRKIGGELPGVSIQKPKSHLFLGSWPTKFSLKFHNDGNIHIVPRGVVTIKRAGGSEAGRAVINPESSLIFPEKSRWYNLVFTKYRRYQWPGKYVVTINYRYDGKSEFTTETVEYTVLNLPLTLALIIFLIVAYFAIRFTVRVTSPLRKLLVRKWGRLIRRLPWGEKVVAFYWTVRSRLIPPRATSPKRSFILWSTKGSQRPPRTARHSKKKLKKLQ